jgi:polysaccharide export outer membrane protein
MLTRAFITILTSALLLIVLSSCSSKSYTLFQKSSDKYETDYDKSSLSFENKISPKDRLSIEVINMYNQTNLGLQQTQNRQNITSSTLLNSNDGFLVGSDGRVFLPLLGYVALDGMTITKASEYLTKEYKKYLRRPFVRVNILNQRIYVLGEVKKPGMVPVLNETMTIYEAIARSGDFTDYALRDSIKVINANNTTPNIRSIDMTSIDALSSANIILKPNDIVYIQPRNMKGFNVGVKETLPLLQAISSALSPFATLKYLEE